MRKCKSEFHNLNDIARLFFLVEHFAYRFYYFQKAILCTDNTYTLWFQSYAVQ